MPQFPPEAPPTVVNASQIGVNAVTTTKINDLAVTTGKLAAGAVTAPKLAAGLGALLSKVANGVAAAGPVTLTGAVVGMKVRQVLTITDGALVDSTALFETTITVTNQIQQTSNSDLSAVVYSFLLQA